MGDNSVKIVINAVDKASQTIKNIDKSADGLSSGFGGLKTALTRVGVAMGVATAAGMAIKNVIDQTVNPTVEYANAVRKTSTALGIQYEETSRLIQVFDDYGVSTEQLTTALEMAAKNGFAPSIENLAKLSDEIMAMDDPTERANKLSKIFGRNWADVSELLYKGGDAIRDQAGAVSDSLIMTDDAVKASREYELALDDLNDQVLALKISVGNKLIPVLTDFIGTLKDTGTEVEKARAITAKSYDTYEDYKKAVDAVYNSTDRYIEAVESGIPVEEALEQQFQALTEEQWKAIKAGEAMTDSFRLEEIRAGKLGGAVEGVTGITEDYTDAADEAAEAQAELNEQLKDALLTGALDGKLQKAWDDYNEALKEGEEAALDEKEALAQATRELVYQNAIIGLSKDAQLELARSLGMVSEKDYEAIKATQELNAEMDPANPWAYQKGVAAIVEALEDGKITAEEMKAALDLLNGTSVDVWINTHKVDVIGNLKPGQQGKGDEFPTGGQFVIPPGYEGHTWPVGPNMWAQSGETVTITPNNSRTYNQNFYITGNPKSILDYQRLRR